jgi:methylmalonyl-CoA epimerase
VTVPPPGKPAGNAATDPRSRRRLHHLGWAVDALTDAAPAWVHAVGLADLGTESFPGLVVQFFAAGECLVELLESSGGDPTVEAVVAGRGGGLHHLAFGVPDVRAALADASARGLRVIDVVPRPGARGTTIAFVDPGWPDGTLLEFVEDPTWAW